MKITDFGIFSDVSKASVPGSKGSVGAQVVLLINYTLQNPSLIAVESFNTLPAPPPPSFFPPFGKYS